MCVYFRTLNKASVKDNYSLPNMELLLQEETRSQIMSLLDGFSRYNQVLVRKFDKHKTNFTTKLGTYAFNRMPFGLINARATFQWGIHIAFYGLISLIILIYLDDLTILYKKKGGHFSHLRNVLLHCRKYGISLNPSKSIFGVVISKLLGLQFWNKHQS